MATTVNFVDVGQGNMVLIQCSDGTHFMVDCNITEGNKNRVLVTVQTSGVELAEGLLMTAGLSVNSRYEPKNSRRSDTQIPSSLNSYASSTMLPTK